MTEPAKIMGWGAIIGILVLVALATGLTLGLLGELLGNRLNLSAGVGAATGIVGALLITRRRAALQARPPVPPG
jgi:hypothetical protein